MKTKITIIGAGVVGLAIASRLSEQYSDIFLIEQHSAFGREASSRNSEVIHASIYYPQNSLKGELCLGGNRMMYDLCSREGIPHCNCTKLIVATNEDETLKLPEILNTAQNNGALDVRLIDRGEIQKIEPKVNALAAIYCPSSGIVDSHKLMQYFERKAISSGVNVVYNHRVIGIEKLTEGYNLIIKDLMGEEFHLGTQIIINSAGLGSGQIAEYAGIDIDKYNYRIHYHKGVYFRVLHQLDKYPKALIYPIPPEEGSVGIHTTPDLYGGMRLGPHFFWDNEINYDVDDKYHDLFYHSAKKFLPFLKSEDLAPDMAGIMASIQKHGEGMKDFVIRDEADKGLAGLINLIGIESPGITASPSIAEYVSKLVEENLI